MYKANYIRGYNCIWKDFRGLPYTTILGKSHQKQVTSQKMVRSKEEWIEWCVFFPYQIWYCS